MKKVFSVLQKIGRSLMLPVSVLPSAGLLYRIGQDDLLGKYGAAFKYLATAGDAIFGNLPLIFAVGVAIGFSGGEAVAALAAVVGQMILQSIMNVAGKNGGIPINMGVFGGISIGLISAILYNRYHKIRLPQVLGFFSGKRFVPMITSVAALIFAVVAVNIWSPMQHIIDIFAKWASTSVLGPAFYAAGKRLLIPVGLHHIYYPAFLYEFGSFTANGVKYFGDTSRFFHGDPTAGIFMASEYPILMFGLPGAAIAMIAAAKPENRKRVSGMMISAAFVSFLTGITEPIEFSFIFVAPILFVFHVLAAFSAGIVTSLLHIRLGYTFSASAIDYILGYKFAAHPLLIWPVGIIYFVLYFSVFYFVIKAMNIKTPGREEGEEVSLYTINTVGLEKASIILEAIGGRDNVEFLDACITRLRATLKNPGAIDKSMLTAAGSAGILEAGNNIQIIFGTEAERIKDDIKSIMENKGCFKDKSKESKSEEEPAHELRASPLAEIHIANPIKGEVISLDKVPDEVFSGKMLGDGFAVRPLDNKVYAPVSGVIRVLFPTKHAVAIKTDEGIEVLVHIGIDTVKLGGEGFEVYVQKGDSVKRGDLLITFDKNIVEKKVKSLISPVIITNMDSVASVSVRFGKLGKDKTAARVVKK
jgi:PTS system, glucose subfamily, IIA component